LCSVTLRLATSKHDNGLDRRANSDNGLTTTRVDIGVVTVDFSFVVAVVAVSRRRRRRRRFLFQGKAASCCRIRATPSEMTNQLEAIYGPRVAEGPLASARTKCDFGNLNDGHLAHVFIC
jgi:hypothetical protein